jgi:hypothetical protein
MKIIYFNVHDGSPLTENVIAGEEALNGGRAFKAEAPDNISNWRLKYDVISKKVEIFGGVEKNEEQALKLKEDNEIIKFKLESEASKKITLDNEKKEYLLKIEREKLLNNLSN